MVAKISTSQTYQLFSVAPFVSKLPCMLWIQKTKIDINYIFYTKICSIFMSYHKNWPNLYSTKLTQSLWNINIDLADFIAQKLIWSLPTFGIHSQSFWFSAIKSCWMYAWRAIVWIDSWCGCSTMINRWQSMYKATEKR